MNPSPRPAAALAGATAGLGGLAVAELVSALLHGRVSPVLAVGESIIELTPGAVAERAISAVGSADKPLLVTGVVVGVLVLSALAGVLMLSHRRVGTALLVLLPAVALVAGLTRSDSRPADVLPPLLGGIAGLVTALWLVPRAARATPATGAPPATAGSPTRRRFLADVGITLLAAGALGGVSRWVGRGRRAVEEARQAVSLGLRPPPSLPAWTSG